MSNRAIKLIEIKKKITMLPGHKLDEVDDSLSFILSRYRREGKKNIQMQGINKIHLQNKSREVKSDLQNMRRLG